MISYKVFMSFVDDSGNAERMQSKECYQTWVHTRKSPPKKPQESFRRVLTAHACGVDGRRPFPEHVEASLLKVLRRKEVWDCFKGTGVSIGIRGFRNVGYHEKLRTEEQAIKNGAVSLKSKQGQALSSVSSKQSARSRKRAAVKDKHSSKKLKASPGQQAIAGIPLHSAYHLQHAALQRLSQFGGAMPFMVPPQSQPGAPYAYSPEMQFHGASPGATAARQAMMNLSQTQQQQEMQQQLQQQMQQMQQLLQRQAQSQSQNSAIAQAQAQAQAQAAQLAQLQAASGQPLVSYFSGQQGGPQMAVPGQGYMVPMHAGSQQASHISSKPQRGSKKYS